MTKQKTQKHKKHHPGIVVAIRNSFFTGVVVALPIVATIMLITWFVDMVDNKVKPLLPTKYIPEWVTAIPGLGILVAVVALWMLGALASNFFGSQLLRFGENLVNRVPLVRNIYNTLKQVVVTVAHQNDRAFKDVCLIEYPRKGTWAIGFVTTDLKGAPADVLKDDYVCVFVPTTPNPTSGFLLFLERSEVTILDMSPEEGAKMIISAGMVASNEELEPLPTSNNKVMKAK